MISTNLKVRERQISKKNRTKPIPFVIQVSSIYPDRINKTLDSSTSLGQYLSHYCDKSTIHGLKYLGERGRYLIEKVIWLVLILLVCVFCLLLIFETYCKWKSSPVILSFENGETPIFDIPFPAVTICPDAKFKPEKFNMAEVYRKRLTNGSLSERENFLFDLYCLVCDNFEEYVNILSKKRFLEPDSVAEFFELFPELKFLGDVQWMGKPVQNTLKKILTQDGVCYTFNMLSFQEIFKNVTLLETPENETKSHNFDLTKGFTSQTDFDTYPRRTFLAEEGGGLLLDHIITNISQLNALCQYGVSGLKMVLHNVLELPNMNKHFRLPLNQAMYVAVKPHLITISSELYEYAPSERNCYFVEERTLWMFKSYTQENCLTECLINCTLLHCGCIPFYMPRPAGVKICGPGNVLCMKESEVSYLDKHYCAQDCDCLPSCYSLAYEIEISQTDWSWKKFHRVLKHIPGILIPSNIFSSEIQLSKVSVFFKDPQFLAAKRHELYGTVDIFSKVGGLCGLCIGLSVVSVVEVIYFFTFRIVCNIKKYGKKFWA